MQVKEEAVRRARHPRRPEPRVPGDVIWDHHGVRIAPGDHGYYDYDDDDNDDGNGPGAGGGAAGPTGAHPAQPQRGGGQEEQQLPPGAGDRGPEAEVGNTKFHIYHF